MLRDAVNGYIELYQSMGFKYRVQSYALRSFADFAERRSEEFVRADSVLEWAASAPSIRQRHDRLRTVYRLACALNAEDQRHEVPPTAVFGGEPRRPRSCHIFTQDEIERLLRAASELAPRGSIRPITYTTLVSLLACTGLRISEALKLELSDLTEDGLLIRATKFQKSRLGTGASSPIPPSAQPFSCSPDRPVCVAVLDRRAAGSMISDTRSR